MSCSSRHHRDHPSGVPGSAHRDNKTSNKTCRVTPGCNVPKNCHLWVHSTNTADYSEHYYAPSSLGWPNDRSRWGQSSLSVLPVSRMARCKVRLALHLRYSTLLRALPSLLLRRSNSPCREAAVCRSWMPLGPLSQSADSNHSRSTQEAPKKRQSLKHCRRARVARWRMIALRACRGGGIQQLKYPLPMQGVVAKSISCRFYRHPSEVLPPDSSYSPTADIDLRGSDILSLARVSLDSQVHLNCDWPDAMVTSDSP